MNEAPLGLLFFVLGVLVLLSGFFSSSETGMMSLNRYRLKHLKKEHRGARRASKLLDQPETLISMILIGNNLVNIFASAIATVIGLRLMGDSGIAIATLLLTLVILIFAEIIPKTIAAYHPERIAFTFSHVLMPLRKLMFPLIWLINQLTHGILRLTGIEKKDGEESLGVEELRTILGESSHMIPKRHRGMLLNILELEDVSVDDIMIPRNEVFGIDLEEPTADIIAKVRDCEFSRIPVYRGDIDNIQGVIYQRDIIKLLGDHQDVTAEEFMAVMREAYYIPENTPLHLQLFAFQKRKTRIGIVVDEYGVMQGIVTLEDLLEEIVGDFTTPQAADENDIIHQTDGSVIIDGTTTIRDINKSLDWDLPTDGPKTLNGLLLEQLESFPEAAVSLTISDYRFEILTMNGNIVQNAKARLTK